MYKYLVTADFYEPFLTNWFDIENNYNSAMNMVVYDLLNNLYYNGSEWMPLQEDHL